MACEFSQSSLDGRTPVCRKNVALPEIIAINSLEGVFTLAQLKAEICDNPDPQARDQCPAHADLSQHGRGSRYCK